MILLSGVLWYFGIWQVVETLRSFGRRKAVSSEAILLLLWFGLSYLAIFIGWRFPGHYHLPVFPPLSILAGEAFSRFVAQHRRSPQPRWRWIRTGIIGAAALPPKVFLIGAFVVRTQTLDFFPIVQLIVKETSPNDRIFVWGSRPQFYSFSDRRMATRFVSCSHLVGVYAQPASRSEGYGEERDSRNLGDVSGRLGSASSGAHHRHLNCGSVLGAASHGTISRASRLP